MKVLVTGATGFIGQNLIRALLKTNHTTIAVCRNPEKLDLKKDNSNLIVLKKDITQPDFAQSVYRKFLQINTIVHLAAYGTQFGLNNNWQEAVNVNVKGTLEVLKLAKLVNCNNYLQTSSCFEYQHSLDPLSENSAVDYTQVYSATKNAATALTSSFLSQQSMASAILRLFTPYGLGENHSRVIPTLIDGARNKQIIELNNPQSFRDFVFIEDLIKLYISLIENNPYRAELLNVGTEVKTTLVELVGIVQSFFNSPLRIKWHRGKRERGQPVGWVADMTKAKKLKLPFYPIPLKVGIGKLLTH